MVTPAHLFFASFAFFFLIVSDCPRACCQVAAAKCPWLPGSMQLPLACLKDSPNVSRRSRAACLLRVLGAPDPDCISTAQVDPSPVLLPAVEHCQYTGLSDIYATPQALTCGLDKRIFFESMTKCCQLHFEL